LFPQLDFSFPEYGFSCFTAVIYFLSMDNQYKVSVIFLPTAFGTIYWHNEQTIATTHSVFYLLAGFMTIWQGTSSFGRAWSSMSLLI
jgi:hypothetical protein